MQAGLRDVVKNILDSLTPREAKVLRKLKHLSRSDKLRSFIDTLYASARLAGTLSK